MLHQHVQPAQELLKNLVSLQCYLFLPVFSLAGYFYVSKSLLQFCRVVWEYLLGTNFHLGGTHVCLLSSWWATISFVWLSAKAKSARALALTDETTGPEPILILSSKNKGVTFGGAASAAKSRVLSPATTTSGSEYASSDETTRSKNSATMQSSQSLSSAESLSSADETVCRGSGGAGSDSKQNTPVNGTRRTDVRSPITAIKTAIRSRGSPNKSAKNSLLGIHLIIYTYIKYPSSDSVSTKSIKRIISLTTDITT